MWAKFGEEVCQSLAPPLFKSAYGFLLVFCVYVQSRAKYLTVAKQMKAYEDLLYDRWRDKVEAVLPTLLKKNLLVSEVSTATVKFFSEETGMAEPADGNWPLNCSSHRGLLVTESPFCCF